MFLDNVKTEFRKLSIAPDRIKGCTENEVKEIERVLQNSIPRAYQEFLLWIGHGAGDFWVGSHWQYEHLQDIQEGAASLLKRNNFPESLPKNAFVFFMHQGYQFLFFYLNEGDDPPVYYYNEVDHETKFEPFYDHFSDYILAEIQASIQYKKEIEEAIKQLQSSTGEDRN